MPRRVRLPFPVRIDQAKKQFRFRFRAPQPEFYFVVAQDSLDGTLSPPLPNAVTT